MDRFAQTLSGAGAEAYGPSPILDSPIINNYTRGQFQVGAGTPLTSVKVSKNNIDLANQEAAQAQAQSEKAQALKDKQQKILDALNGKNYQVLKKEDGGQDYYDPLGNKINLLQYTKATGTKAVDVLKDSENTLDRQFINDYNNVNDLVHAYLNKDGTKIDKVGERLGYEPGKLNELLKKSGIKPEDLLKKFVSYYPNVYTNQQQGQTGQVRSQAAPALGYVNHDRLVF